MSVLDHLDAIDAALVDIGRAAAAGQDVSRAIMDARMIIVAARQLVERDPTGKFPKIEPVDEPSDEDEEPTLR